MIRFLGEVAFIVVVALALWLLQAGWPVVIVGMALALVTAWTFEWVSWRLAQWQPQERLVREERAAAAAAPPAVSEPEAEPEPEPVVEPEPVPVADATPADVDIDQLRQLWPAVVDQVRSENAMVGACLDAARPLEIEGARLTICFPTMGGFSRKTVEKNRELVQTALRALTGCSFALDYEMNDDAAPDSPLAAGLSDEELIERLKRDYGATEIFDDEQE